MGNLTPETTSFVGRGAELSALAKMVADAPLVTLTGVGGVGKTRLAQRVGAEQQSVFPDGVWLVELSPLSATGPIGLAVYETLRLADQSSRTAMEVVTDWLADKRLLLILDCCEHLAAPCADIIKVLLAAAPGVRILATSRCPLKAPDEHVVPVPPLPVTAADHSPGATPAEAAVLFLERAADAAPHTPLVARDRAAVTEICTRLEGIPLAIELAAARLSDMALDQLRERLQTRFETLTAQRKWQGEGEPRHQALRTTIGWSHELCAPLERLLWARLSVFADGFEQEAAEWVCAGGPLASEQVPGLLSHLVDKSVLQRTGTPRGPRYAMLDTLREYGEQWLRGLGEHVTLSRRHRDYCRWVARRGCAEWAGPDQVLWCERAIADQANMRAAMERCLTAAERSTAVEMAGCVGFLWRHCGFHRDAQRYLDLVLDPDPLPGPERTWALFVRGCIAFAQGDLEAGGRWGAACAAAASQPGHEEPGASVGAAGMSGMSLAMRGELARAAEMLDGAPHQPVLDARYRIAPLQLRMARLYTHVVSGEIARARVVADELRADCRRYGERWVCSYADYLRALVDLAQGEAHAAVRHAREALEGHRLLHNTTGVAVVLDTLASAVLACGTGEQAACLLGLGQQFWQTVGRDQMDSPGLVAIRRACEAGARQAIGDTAYEAAFATGLESSIDDAIAYTLPPQ
ncbi:ATP-binding protein [Streptomyces violens]|uniref:ATP-binding protein n=1 Tax=Streptomyces violens TaxID=66377 RepID=UPI001FE04CA6|nr:NB-ARC domain-containing protein [Streptomyces violens]